MLLGRKAGRWRLVVDTHSMVLTFLRLREQSFSVQGRRRMYVEQRWR